MEGGGDITKIGKEQLSITVQSGAELDKSQYSALIDEVMRVEAEAWLEEWRATRDKFEARLEVFPEGFFLASSQGQLAGVSTSEVVNYDPKNPPKTWDEITDNGFIRGTQNLAGNALYVVSVGVSADFQGQGIGHKLVEAQKELTKRLSLERLVLGARIPGYHSYHQTHPTVSAQNYVTLEETPRAGKKLDPEIRFYESCGLEVVKVMPNYGPDVQSENFGVIMVWRNSDFSS